MRRTRTWDWYFKIVNHFVFQKQDYFPNVESKANCSVRVPYDQPAWVPEELCDERHDAASAQLAVQQFTSGKVEEEVIEVESDDDSGSEEEEDNQACIKVFGAWHPKKSAWKCA